MNDRRSLRIRTAALSAAIAVFCTTAQARIWHVCHTELPGIESGRQARSIGEAARGVESGDTVIIHNGIYREEVVIEKSGTADEPITFQAAVGANVIVTGADHISEWTEVEGEGNVYRTHWP